jgi:hypothetical protein
MPKVVDVPIMWQRGGGVTCTFPITPASAEDDGDECLVVFSSRCIDAWWKNGYSPPAGGTGADGKPFNPANNPPVWRMANLSDGFAFFGPLSQPNALDPAPSTDSWQLRTDDGDQFVDFNPTTGALSAVTTAVNLTSDGGISGGWTVGNGASGTFTTPTGQTVTVQDGIVTNIF